MILPNRRGAEAMMDVLSALVAPLLSVLLPWQRLTAEPLQIVDTLASLQPKAGQPPVEAQILLHILQHYPSTFMLVDISSHRARVLRDWQQMLVNP